VPGRHGFSKEFVSQAFFFAFGEIGLSRLTGPTRGSNTMALKIAPKFGFTLEGVMRKAFQDGDDCYLFGYLIEDYLQHRWLKYYNIADSSNVSYYSRHGGNMTEVKKKASPSKRQKPWVTIAIRKEAYDKLLEMARVDNRTIGGEMTWLIETAYEQVM
jgi:hypothetical protein